MGGPVSAIAGAGDRLARWFLDPQPLHALVGARVILGLTLFATYLGRAHVVPDYFGPAGFAGHDFYARNPAADPLHPFMAEPLRALVSVSSVEAIWIAYGLALVAALAFAAGAWTRLSGVLLLVLHALFYARNPFCWDGSWAGFILAPLFYCVVAPSGRHLSLDAWRRRQEPGAGAGAAPGWLAPGWPLRLLQIHTCAMYAAAGWSRLDKASWLHGDMVYIALTGMTHSRLGIDWDALRGLLMAGTWAAFLLEGLAPFVLWIRGIGRWWALALVGLHLSLELLTNVGFWSWVMVAGLLAFLLPGPGRGAEAS